jgi:hypothetical protein
MEVDEESKDYLYEFVARQTNVKALANQQNYEAEDVDMLDC